MESEWGGIRRRVSDRVGQALVSVGLRDVRQTAAFQNGNTIGQVVGIIGDLVQLPHAVSELWKLAKGLPKLAGNTARFAGNVARQAWSVGRRIATQISDDIAEGWGAFGRYLDEASRRVYDSMFGNGRRLATEGADFEGRVARFADEGGDSGIGSSRIRFEQVPYDDNGLAGMVRRYRINTPFYNKRNLAIYQYYKDVDGELELQRRLFASSDVGHAEQVGWEALRGDGIDPSNVVKVYSELEPCSGVNSPQCGQFLQQLLKNTNAVVQYSFEYGQQVGNVASKNTGREAWANAIDALGRAYRKKVE